MKIEIEVKDASEGTAICAALADPTTRALVVTMGLLLPLSPRARKRTMAYVVDVLDEHRQVPVPARPRPVAESELE